MQSKIEIKNLKIYAKHGVLDFEKSTLQLFIVNANIYFDFTKAANADDLNLSISYCDIMQDINDYVVSNTFNLIETLAYKTALHILNKYQKINRIVLSVDKPNAPYALDFESVSTCVDLTWHDVYLSLGSNLGDKLKNLDDAINYLSSDEIKIVDKSSVLYNPPYGGVADQEFANMCVYIKTILSPFELLDTLHVIEDKMHRVRDKRWGNRIIDLDIVFFDNLEINTKDLTIPHKDYLNRDFVLIPLKEIAPFLNIFKD